MGERERERESGRERLRAHARTLARGIASHQSECEEGGGAGSGRARHHLQCWPPLLRRASSHEIRAVWAASRLAATRRFSELARHPRHDMRHLTCARLFPLPGHARRPLVGRAGARREHAHESSELALTRRVNRVRQQLTAP